MSTLMYAAVTTKRLQAPKERSTSTEKPGLKTYVDAMAALVPAEVLAAHAVIISYATKSKVVGGKGITTITNVHALTISFYSLIGITIVLYLGARKVSNKGLEPLDFVRALIPGAAFVLWTMLQKSTAFDAVSPDTNSSSRAIYAVLLALVVGAVASALGIAADKKDP